MRESEMDRFEMAKVVSQKLNQVCYVYDYINKLSSANDIGAQEGMPRSY